MLKKLHNKKVLQQAANKTNPLYLNPPGVSAIPSKGN